MIEAAIAALLSVAASVTTVAVIARKMSLAAITQNESYMKQGRTLVDAALENMTANTDAIRAASSATTALATTLNQAIAVQDERDRTMFKQLDRIEGNFKGSRHG